MKYQQLNFVRQTLRQSTAALLLSAIFVVPLAANAQQMNKPTKSAVKTNAAGAAKKLSDDQKILHVLNRLGYGARPGDLEKVRQIGLSKYIEQQLNPAGVEDSALEAKLGNLPALKMSNDELFAKYPAQAAVVQLVAQNNGIAPKQLRGDLKEARQQRKEQKNAAMNGADDNSAGAMMNNGAMSPQMPQTDAPKAMDAPPSAVPQGGLLQQKFEGLSDADKKEFQRQIVEVYRQYDLRRPNEMTQQLNSARILRAVYSERQLQEQMVDFWSNHFNVYVNKASVRWFLPEFDRDVIRPNALGNFRDLLTATAKSPAMLFYLDNYQSVAPNAQPANNNRLQRLMQNGQLPERARQRIQERTGMNDEQLAERLKKMQNQAKNRRGINENYARELMELHSLGVGGGYTQQDVQEVARCFTGWTIIDARGYRKFAAKTGDDNQNRAINGLRRMGGIPADAASGTFFFNEKQHDSAEKIVLGQKIATGGGMEDGLKVIDILMKQPATAKFIARKLAVKFVSDNPSDDLVNRAAAAFQKSNGDIKTTLRALIDSPDFYAPENYRAKIKTPLEVVASSLRTLNAETNASPALQNLLGKMGEPLYGWITPNGYPETAENWVNTGALLERLNFGLAVAANRIPGTKINLSKFAGRDPDNKENVMDTFVGVILNGEVSPLTKATLLKQLNQPIPEPTLAAKNSVDGEMMENAAMTRPNNGGGRRGQYNQAQLLPSSGNQEVVKIVGLILGSPEFQRQ